MADDLAESLTGFGTKIRGVAKAIAGGADMLGSKLGMDPVPAPMPGRLPLGEIPKTMPMMKTPTGDLKKKRF